MPTLRSRNGLVVSMPGSFGQAEHPLADDVAHHLVAAAGDAQTGDAHHELRPRVGPPLAGVGDQLGTDESAPRSRVTRIESCVPASLAMLNSGPGVCPERMRSSARWFVYPLTRERMTRSASAWRTSGSSASPKALVISIARRDEADATAAAARADRRPFVHQRRQGDGPAVVDVAEAVVVGHPYLVEEHLVEAGAAGHLAQRADLHARRPHVDDEPGETLVLGQVRVRPRDDLADVAVLGARRPHLLPASAPTPRRRARPASAGWPGRCRRRAPRTAGRRRCLPDTAPAGSAPWRRRAAVGEDRRGDHAEPDDEEGLVGNVVAGSRGGRRPAGGPPRAGGRRILGGPVIQPSPASNRVARHDLAAASDACSAARSRSSNIETLSDPRPQTKRSSACFSSALALRNDVTSVWNSSIPITPTDRRGLRATTATWPGGCGAEALAGPPVGDRSGLAGRSPDGWVAAARPARHAKIASQPVVARRNVPAATGGGGGSRHGPQSARVRGAGGQPHITDGRSTRPNVADLLDQPLTTAATKSVD